MVWLPPVLISALLVILALAAELLRRRYAIESNALVDAVDNLLPQTQCAQCGYPGCRPYADAIVAGKAALNLCPPGGAEVHHQLQELMGDESTANVDSPALPQPALAYIDEQACIGCALCLMPCPVDAIVGAAHFTHTVIAAQCTGCELCVDACPVDCISMVELPSPESIPEPAKNGLACIRCGQCDPACPVDLPVQDLIALVTTGAQLPLAEQHGLSRCIECRRCDRVCPSEIPLAEIFAAGKRELAAQTTLDAARQNLKLRYLAHNERIDSSQDRAAARRAQRLQARRFQ
jgi:electron transport complex protein RnfB